MTPDEARERLGVAATATRTEIERRYRELYTDCQLLITQAPTPALRKLYEQHLRELDAARAALTTTVPDNESTQDLPSPVPVAFDAERRRISGYPAAQPTDNEDRLGTRAREFTRRFLPTGVGHVAEPGSALGALTPSQETLDECVHHFASLIALAEAQGELQLLHFGLMEASALTAAYVASGSSAGLVINGNEALIGVIRRNEPRLRSLVDAMGGSGTDALKRLTEVAKLLERLETEWNDHLRSQATWGDPLESEAGSEGYVVHVERCIFGGRERFFLRESIVDERPQLIRDEHGAVLSFDTSVDAFFDALARGRRCGRPHWIATDLRELGDAPDLDAARVWCADPTSREPELSQLMDAWCFLGRAGVTAHPLDVLEDHGKLVRHIGALIVALNNPDVPRLTAAVPLDAREREALAQTIATGIRRLQKLVDDRNGGLRPPENATLLIDSCQLRRRILFVLREAQARRLVRQLDENTVAVFFTIDEAREYGTSLGKRREDLPKRPTKLDEIVRWCRSPRSETIDVGVLMDAWSFLFGAGFIDPKPDTRGAMQRVVWRTTSTAIGKVGPSASTRADLQAKGLDDLDALARVLEHGIDDLWRLLPAELRRCGCNFGPGMCHNPAIGPGWGLCMYCDDSPVHAHCATCGAPIRAVPREGLVCPDRHN